MSQVFLTSSSRQTKKIAEGLAQKILKIQPRRRAFLIGLIGELGSGKTAFAQGMAKGLGIKGKITSPTFIIMRKFQIPKPKSQKNPKSQIPKFKNFYHFDCYRINEPKELLDLGFKKIITAPRNIVAIEWADRIKELLPKNAVLVKFKLIGKNARKIKIK